MAYETRGTENLSQIAPDLLRWYDAHARELPWRVGPKARKKGARPDPYHVWLSEIMLQQTTVAAVTPRYETFLRRWPDVTALAAAPLEDVLSEWAGLGYYARARNLHKCAVAVVQDCGGDFPDTEEGLRALPGIGAYTAAAIAAIAFDKRAIVVDGNIERVASRLFAIETPLPKAKQRIKALTGEIWPLEHSGDFAQGLMDLGASVCKPKAPTCLICPLTDHCSAFALGRQAAFPKKPPRKPKPARTGAVFALTNAKGAVLFERRPEKGLLGGMLGLPGTEWKEEKASDAFSGAPVKAKWKRLGDVSHTFTHFHLSLAVYVAPAPKGFRRKQNQQWIAPAGPRLPTVMKKAIGLVLEKTGE